MTARPGTRGAACPTDAPPLGARRDRALWDAAPTGARRDRALWFAPLLLVSSPALAPAQDASPVAVALVVANDGRVSHDGGAGNVMLDTLRYAEADGRQNCALAAQLADEVECLASGATRERVGAAARALEARLGRARAAGRPTVAYLFFTSHGTLEYDADGTVRGTTLFLADPGGGPSVPLGREDLYDELVAPLMAADRVWVFVDACHAFYTLFRESEDRPGHVALDPPRSFAARFPDARDRIGAITATSGRKTMWEWGRFEGSVFGHELRSALRGGADPDGDGRVTLVEIMSFLEAANEELSDPEVQFHATGRHVDPDAVLVDWRSGSGPRARSATVRVAEGDAALITLMRGEAELFNVHREAAATLRLHLPPERTYALVRSPGDARLVPPLAPGTETEAATLPQGRGSYVVEVLARGLFKVPYGIQYHRRFVRARAPELASMGAWTVEASAGGEIEASVRAGAVTRPLVGVLAAPFAAVDVVWTSGRWSFGPTVAASGHEAAAGRPTTTLLGAGAGASLRLTDGAWRAGPVARALWWSWFQAEGRGVASTAALTGGVEAAWRSGRRFEIGAFVEGGAEVGAHSGRAAPIVAAGGSLRWGAP